MTEERQSISERRVRGLIRVLKDASTRWGSPLDYELAHRVTGLTEEELKKNRFTVAKKPRGRTPKSS